MKIGFIFSLPRSGSTFVQRVLSQGDGIATTSEPWLLPCLTAIRSGEPPAAAFGYDHARIALRDLVDRYDVDDTWDQCVRGFAENFYGALADRRDHIFIDKTPRNAAFVHDILRIFPEAPVLFLWRNPLAVVNSINQSWAGGAWKAYFYNFDLYNGLLNMVNAYENVRDHERVMSARYEDICDQPREYFAKIFDHFGSTFDERFLENVPKIEGALGDKVGQEKYSDVRRTSGAPQWTRGFRGVPRYLWARQYLAKIGERPLRVMGYDAAQLRRELSLRGVGKLSDFLFVPLSPAYHVLEPYLIRTKLRGGKLRRYARR